MPKTLRRLRHYVLNRLHPTQVDFVYSPEYQVDLGGSPIDVRRAERILTFLLSERLLSPKRLHRPHSASLQDLEIVHSAAYLESLRHPDALIEIVGTEVWPDLHQKALQAQRWAVGGTVLATQLALNRTGVAVNLGGGFHHAGIVSGKGFCIFNDVAIAVRKARQGGCTDPVLVIDLDLHDGNGTREIFARDPSVFTFSIHNQSWDQAPADASLAIELGDGVGDEIYLQKISDHLPALLEEIRPSLVFHLAGTDPAHDDRLGNWCITARGMLQRDRYVVGQVSDADHPAALVILLAGGYGHEAWRYSARSFAWLLTGRTGIEPPSTTAMTLSRYRHLTQDLRGTLTSQRSRDEDWGLTEEELLGSFGVDAARQLFLGLLSPHEVELILEWTGLLDGLRNRGFAEPDLAVDLDDASGHTLRLFADSGRSELLMELRLSRDRHSIAGMELLALEWLLLQNPKAGFSGQRVPLPGQRHPGLGLLSDVMSLLILLVDRLQLDGIVFVPSHYHLAFKGKRYLRFLNPVDEAWFRSVRRAVEDLSLAEATRAVAEGRVVDSASEEAETWRPMRMVLPISDRLHDFVEGEDYEGEVIRAMRQLSFRLA